MEIRERKREKEKDTKQTKKLTYKEEEPCWTELYDLDNPKSLILAP